MLLTSCMTALAVPAMRGVKKTITLADGTQVVATLTGDEHMHYYSTADGRAIKRVDGQFRYVSLDSLRQVGRQRSAQRNGVRMASARKANSNFTGSRRGLVILVKFTGGDDFIYDLSEWNDYFNKVGYNSYGMGGSVHDYFLEQSYGKFDLQFDVIGPVTVSHTEAYYTTWDDYYVPNMIEEACRQVDNRVNFADYDWDGDGYVDQVYVIYQGYGEAQGADGTIWPHEWELTASGVTGDNGYTAYQTSDGVKVNTYACSPELHGDGKADPGKIDGIGTACHEFSHCMNLPDFYDTTSDDGTAWGMDVWSLMDYGCYNGNYGYVPCGYTAYERMFCGWLEPTELNSATRVCNMPDITTSPTAYIIYNDGNRNEYYMLSNIQKTGFNSEVYGTGMMALHVDYDADAWKSDIPNSDGTHQRMHVVTADGVEGKAGSNAAGDLYPGTSNNTELTNTSSPAATVYTKNTDGKYLLNKPITGIDECDGMVSFNFMGAQTSLATPTVYEASAINLDQATFTATWDAVPGAKGYQVRLTKSVSDGGPANNILLADDFSGCYSKIDKLTADISSSLDTYLQSEGWTGENLYRTKRNLRLGTTSGTAGWVQTPVVSTEGCSAITFTIGILNTSVGSGTAEVVLSYGGYDESVTVNTSTSASSDFGYYSWPLDSWKYSDLRIKVSGNCYLGYLGVFGGYYEWAEISAMLSGSSTKGQRMSNIVTYETYTTTGTSYTFQNVQPGQYTYKVRAYTDDDQSDWSDEFSVDMSKANAISQLSAETAVQQTGTYTLDGRRADCDNLPRGLYIRNGRKVVVK